MKAVILGALIVLGVTACVIDRHQRPWLYYPPEVVEVENPMRSAIQDGLQSGRQWQIYHVLDTGSMRPMIRGGDLVLCERVPYEDLRIGDIVSYRPAWNNRRNTLHRLVAKDSGGWILAGDNNVNSEVFERMTAENYDSRALRFYRLRTK